MFSNSDPAILHALSNLRYEDVPWLRHQTIDSLDFNEIFSTVLSLCKSNDLPLNQENLNEQSSKKYFEKYRFHRFLFTTEICPETIKLITMDYLKNLRFLGAASSNHIQRYDFQTLENAKAALLNAKLDAPCFLMVTLIPFGGHPIKTRPKAVFCLEASLTNATDIWDHISFPLVK